MEVPNYGWNIAPRRRQEPQVMNEKKKEDCQDGSHHQHSEDKTQPLTSSPPPSPTNSDINREIDLERQVLYGGGSIAVVPASPPAENFSSLFCDEVPDSPHQDVADAPATQPDHLHQAPSQSQCQGLVTPSSRKRCRTPDAPRRQTQAPGASVAKKARYMSDFEHTTPIQYQKSQLMPQVKQTTIAELLDIPVNEQFPSLTPIIGSQQNPIELE